jgi:uncharacterized phage protein (TIGR02216 family)
MAFGLGVLRLSPAAFWAMTPREMAAAMRAVLPDAPTRLGKTGLEALMRRYPDS